jgi:multidrug resistance efflux pump
VAQAESDVGTAEAELEEARAGVEKAEAEVDQAQADLALVKAGNREEDIVVAEAAVAQAEAALTEAQNALDDAVLRAPFDGTVGAIYVGEGELALSGAEAVRLGDLTRLRVETEDLSEVDVDQVRVGQAAIVTADALTDQEFPGEVTEVAPVSTDHRGDTVYTVTIDLGLGPESGLRWGMSTFVEIQVQQGGDEL